MALFDILEIKKLLPHRYPFLLVDRVIEGTPGETLTALKNVTVNEPFFEGHFPGRPIMPGVLLVEALAQAAALMASHGADHVYQDDRIYYLTGIDKARFKRPVEPGDQVIFNVSIIRRIKNVFKVKGVATVDDKVCVSAELMFTLKTQKVSGYGF